MSLTQRKTAKLRANEFKQNSVQSAKPAQAHRIMNSSSLTFSGRDQCKFSTQDCRPVEVRKTNGRDIMCMKVWVKKIDVEIVRSDKVYETN